jgi:phospholipid/cholesterol/gamma-HCH transport system substrate-binding protein
MKRRDELLVGAMIIAAILVLVVGTVWLVRGGLSQGYPLYARFRWGAGAKQGQPVLLSGVNIGYVDDVILEPNGTILIKMMVENKYRVPEGTKATIDPNGFFGDVLVGLHPDQPSTNYIARGDTVPTGKAGPSMSDLLAKVDSIGGTLGDVAKTVDVQLIQAGGIQDLRHTLAQTNQLVTQLSQIAAEQSKQLTATMTSLHRAVSALDSAEIDSTVKNLRTSSANLTTLTNNLANTTAHLDEVMAKVDTGQGSAGKLVNDPALYNDVHSLLNRLDSLTADFKQHPKKYVRLSIF